MNKVWIMFESKSTMKQSIKTAYQVDIINLITRSLVDTLKNTRVVNKN